MKELFSIKAREQTYRIILLGTFIAAAVISIASLWYANKSIQESKKNIYVLKNDQALIRAVSTDLTNSYDILTRAAVVRINQLIYQHIPDAANINKQLAEAVNMSDKVSVRTVIDVLKEHSFYQNLLSQNFFTILTVDSTSIDYSRDPHPWVFMGTLQIIRDGMAATRQIITSGEIENMGMVSEDNRSGFIVRRMKLVSDIDKPKK